MNKQKDKSDSKGFTIIELIALIIVIMLFWFGLKFGARFVAGNLPDHGNEHWFSLVVLIAGVISGIIPVAAFIALCMGIGMFLQKRKNKNLKDNSKDGH